MAGSKKDAGIFIFQAFFFCACHHRMAETTEPKRSEGETALGIAKNNLIVAFLYLI
ncbi:MAG: hypothetical protein IJ141_01445 [Lachnospiraceae bacterium]|nr:hypothetical protein [Lachnospiraceae bacterium]